jgi:thiol-disulfide isomerase/thioredoxin
LLEDDNVPRRVDGCRALGVTVVRHIEVEAQDTQNIPGSSPLYSLSGVDGWINSKLLTAKELKGMVLLVAFWDYSCINCIRAIPYIRAWADKYGNSGLIVIGVQTPEFDIEKEMPNVETLSRAW